MFEKCLKILLLLCAVMLGSSVAFDHLAAQTPAAESSSDTTQEPPATEPSIPPAAEPPLEEAPEPMAIPTEIIDEPEPAPPTSTPVPEIAATEPSSDPLGNVSSEPTGTPIDATPAIDPSPTPTVSVLAAKIIDVQFSPIDPVSSPAVSTGIITVSYTNAPTAGWGIVLTFDDFAGMGNADAVPAATLSYLGVTGAEPEHAAFDAGVLTLSFSADSAAPQQGTLLVTVQLSIPDPYGATSYQSQLTLSAVPDRSI